MHYTILKILQNLQIQSLSDFQNSFLYNFHSHYLNLFLMDIQFLYYLYKLQLYFSFQNLSLQSHFFLHHFLDFSHILLHFLPAQKAHFLNLSHHQKHPNVHHLYQLILTLTIHLNSLFYIHFFYNILLF